MALDPKSHDSAVAAAVALAIVATLLAVLAAPDVASAALRSAAGGKSGGGGGFARFVAVHQPPGGLHDPDRQRVLRAGSDLGRAVVPGGRRARRSRPRVRRTRRRRRAPLQADRRLMPAGRIRAMRAARVDAACWWRRARCCRPRRRRPRSRFPALPNPFDLGLPSPTDLIGKVFEFFFNTFFGIQAKVTQRTVEWLLAAPVYTDTRAYADLNAAAREHRGRSMGAVHARLHGLGRPLLRLRLHVGGLLRGRRGARARRCRRRHTGVLPAGHRIAGDRRELPDLRDHPRAQRRGLGSPSSSPARRSRASLRSASGRSRRSSPS